MYSYLKALEINVNVLCFWGWKAHEAVCFGNSREAGEASLTLTSVTHTKPPPTYNPWHPWPPRPPHHHNDPTRDGLASFSSVFTFNYFHFFSGSSLVLIVGECVWGKAANPTKLEETCSFATETNQFRTKTIDVEQVWGVNQIVCLLSLFLCDQELIISTNKTKIIKFGKMFGLLHSAPFKFYDVWNVSSAVTRVHLSSNKVNEFHIFIHIYSRQQA